MWVLQSNKKWQPLYPENVLRWEMGRVKFQNNPWILLRSSRLIASRLCSANFRSWNRHHLLSWLLHHPPLQPMQEWDYFFEMHIKGNSSTFVDYLVIYSYSMFSYLEIPLLSLHNSGMLRFYDLSTTSNRMNWSHLPQSRVYQFEIAAEASYHRPLSCSIRIYWAFPGGHSRRPLHPHSVASEEEI